MSSRQLKLGLATVCVIAASVAFNLLAMQPVSTRGARPERAYRGLDALPGVTSTSLPRDVSNSGHGATTAAGGARTQYTRGPKLTDDLKRSVQDELAARYGEADGIAGLMTRAANE